MTRPIHIRICRWLLVCLVVAAYSGVPLHAQSLTLFDIDASAHPTMRAKFYAFDAQGNVQRPLAAELAITEDGVSRTITNVTCPTPAPPRALSSVLVVDVSGSMSGSINNTSKIDLAQSAARSWVNALPLGNSECALVSFDGANYLNQDFTTDRTRLLAAIDKLGPLGNTDYNMALIEPAAGGLLVSKNGKHQRLIILVTDGHAPDPNISAIIDEANRQSCIIFCVTLGLPAPQSLRTIATQSGGEVFENVTTIEQAELVYRNIMATAQNSTPCGIEWQSGFRCQAGGTDAMLNWQGQTAVARYLPPSTAVAKLEFSPPFYRFERPPIGTPIPQTVTVTASNAAFTVTNITTSNPAYTLTPTSFSLQPNESRTLTLTYTAADSGFTFARFTLENALCLQSFFASGGYPGIKPKTPTLKLTHPNGGETFVVGSDTVITWEGIPPTDLVELHYTIDNGATWKLIDTARGLAYRWTNVPRPTSSTCRVRVEMIPVRVQSAQKPWQQIRMISGLHGDLEAGVAFSPNGRMVAAASRPTVKLLDPTSGEEVRTLEGGRFFSNCLAFSPDGGLLAAGGSDGTTNAKDIIRIWDPNTGEVVRTLQGHSDDVRGVAFSPDGGTLASASVDTTIRVWSLYTGEVIRTLHGHLRPLTDVDISPDGSTLASRATDAAIKLWDLQTGQEIRTLTTASNAYMAVFSPDGSALAGGVSYLIKLWDPQTGRELQTMRGHTAYIWSVDFSPDGRMLVSGSYDRTIKVWDAVSGLEIRTLLGHSSQVRSVAFSPDGGMIVSRSHDGTIRLWSVGAAPIQADQSDAVFSIVEPLAEASDIDLGQCLVGSAKDSVVVDLVRNVGTYPFEVRSVSFTGPDAAAFALVSGIPTYRVDAATSHFGEFRFEPTRVGLHQAQIVIVTQSDTLVQNIRGTGVAPLLAIVSTLVDFGRIPATTSKDTLRVATVRNVGNAPLTITDVRHAGPNDTDFTTIAGGGSFVLQPGETHLMDLRFTANNVGRTSGTLEFSYNGVGSPAVVQLFADAADTVRTTIALPSITARVGQAIAVPLAITQHIGFDQPSAPRRFVASITLNPTVVHVTDPSLTCTAVDAYRCEYTIAGSRGTSDTLALIPAMATLGNTDYSPIQIVDFNWLDTATPVVITTLDGSIRLTDICDVGGTRLYVPGNIGYSLASRPNPAQSVAELQFGLAGAGPVVIDVIDQTGRLVFTPVNEAALPAGLHTRTVDVSTLSNGPYILLLRSDDTTLTSRLDVVR